MVCVWCGMELGAWGDRKDLGFGKVETVVRMHCVKILFSIIYIEYVLNIYE